MSQLRLNDGTEIPIFYCATVQDTLWVHMSNDLSVSEGAALFANEAVLGTITYIHDGTETPLTGYTETIRAARNEFTNETVVVLKRPLAGE